MSNIPTVQRLYEAFGTGDGEAFAESLADDVEWDVWDPPSPIQDTVPYLQPRRGKSELGGFFEAVSGLRLHRFEPLNFLEGGDQVAVTIAVDVEVAATGKRFGDLELHLWTFGPDGKVVSLRHMVDTLKHANAAIKDS